MDLFIVAVKRLPQSEIFCKRSFVPKVAIEGAACSEPGVLIAFSGSRASPSRPRGDMKDVQQLLAEKENELARIQKEIQSLQMVLPLLVDESPTDRSTSAPESIQPQDRKPPENASQSISEEQATGTEGAPQTDSESKLWGFTKRWRNK